MKSPADAWNRNFFWQALCGATCLLSALLLRQLSQATCAVCLCEGPGWSRASCFKSCGVGARCSALAPVRAAPPASGPWIGARFARAAAALVPRIAVRYVAR